MPAGSNPHHVIEYTSGGEVRQEFFIVLGAEYVSGQPTPSDESSHVEWVDHSALDDYPMHQSMRMRIDYPSKGLSEPYLD